MKKWEDLNYQEKTEVTAHAISWYNRHKQHVQLVMTESNNAVAPSGSDIYRPELWKSIHWNWLNQQVSLLK